MLACQRKIKDNAPEIRPAGKVFPKGGSAKDCFAPPSGGRVTPDRIQRLRAGQARLGVSVDMRMRNGDLPLDPDKTFGCSSASSQKADDLVNPPMKTKFQQMNLEEDEFVYHSRRNGPLGKSHDQSSGFPKGFDPERVGFGILSEKGEPAGLLVSPQKTAAQVDKEYYEGSELYKKSHRRLDVGEMVDRNYDWSTFTKDSLYGIEIPHDNSGTQVKTNLNWPPVIDGKKLIAKQLDDFREKSRPQVGQVHDPIKETLDVPSDHTFGLTVPIDSYTAGECIHKEPPTDYAEHLVSVDEGILTSLRNHLKKNKFHNITCLLDAFQHLDNKKCGVLSAEDIHEVCFQFSVPLTFDMLNMLITWCTVKCVEENTESNEGVAYADLVTLMDWKHSLQKDILERLAQNTTAVVPVSSKTKSPEEQPTDQHLKDQYKTTSQAVKATVGNISTDNYRSFGVPTIRSDLPAPRIKRVSDMKNYGDESDSYGLMYPSVYSNHGVYDKDFLIPQPPEKIREIFKNIGVTMKREVFEELWELAAKKDPRGQVCVETFRSVMEEVQGRNNVLLSSDDTSKEKDEEEKDKDREEKDREEK